MRNNHRPANAKIEYEQVKPRKDSEIHRRELDKGKKKESILKQENFLYQSWEGKKLIPNNAFVLMGITCPIVHAITILIKLTSTDNFDSTLALLKKDNYPKKY